MTPRPSLFRKTQVYEFLLAFTGSELGRRLDRATYDATRYDVHLYVARGTNGSGMSGGNVGDAAVIALTDMIARVR